MSNERAHTHHAIDYVELTVGDLAAARQFYADAFGWEFNDYGPHYAGIRIGGREVGGLRQSASKTSASPASSEGPLIVLYSDDLESSRAAVEKAGGVAQAPFEFPGGRRFHFTDPSGNELAVWASG